VACIIIIIIIIVFCIGLFVFVVLLSSKLLVCNCLVYFFDCLIPRFMSPEALNNPSVVSTKADVYSFGILLWELLTLQKLDFNV
jgi:hypothetical protein